MTGQISRADVSELCIAALRCPEAGAVIVKI